MAKRPDQQVRDIERALKRAERDIALGVQRGLVKAGLKVKSASRAIVPVETGRLKESAFVGREGNGFKARVKIGYNAPYATEVHENLDYQHDPGKSAKFLERPVRELRPELLRIIQREASRRKM